MRPGREDQVSSSSLLGGFPIVREVEFREKFRGYHPEDVDTFLDAKLPAVTRRRTVTH